MNWTLISASLASLVGLVCAASVTASVMRNIDKIGDIPKLKKDILFRSMFNFYAILALSFVVLIRALDLIHQDLFLGLFVIILGGLGFKISAELIQRNGKDD